METCECRLKRLFRMVVDAVVREFVSGPQFPSNRELSGNFVIFALGTPPSVPELREIAIAWSEIPCAEQQGICIQKQGLKKTISAKQTCKGAAGISCVL